MDSAASGHSSDIRQDSRIVSVFKYCPSITTMPAKGIPGEKEDILSSMSKVIHADTKDRYKYAMPREKQKMLWANAACVALIILVTAFIIFFLLYSGKIPENQESGLFDEIGETSMGSQPPCGDDCLLQNAIADRAAASCVDIANESKRQDCYVRIAAYSVETCLKLENYSQKKSCTVFHAVRLDNAELCTDLNASDREQCISQADSCYAAAPAEKPSCKALSQKDYRFCEKESECILLFAQQNGDVTACNELTTRLKRNICVSIALKKDECASLPSGDEIDSCREAYALRTNQSSVCSFIAMDSGHMLNCYSHFAVQGRNMNLCSGMGPAMQWNCYREYARRTGDMTGCTRIINSSATREFCFMDIAKIFGNPQACEFLAPDPETRQTCFTGAIQNNSMLVHDKCANLSRGEWSMRCYANAAKLERNISVCDLQDDKAGAKFCRDNYYN